jgi:hypothetical protein
MPNRSPSYPSVSLPVALERVKLLHDIWGQVEISVSDALDCWGYSPFGGAGHRLLSTMISFGLIDSSEIDNERWLRISRIALDKYISNQVSEYEKSDAIKEFALGPICYQLLWERWGYDLPADDKLKQFLVGELNLNPRMVPQFLRCYRETLEFAKGHGLSETCDDIDFEDTDLNLDEDESEFAFGKSLQDYLFSEDDTDLEIKIASESYRSSPGDLALELQEEDTILDATTIDLPLEPISNASEYQLDDDGIEFTLSDNDNSEVIYSSNLDNIGNLLRNRTNKTNAPRTRKTTCYQVASNCNIYLSSDSRLDRNAIEALIAQLKLQLELGEFDPKGD